jgi:hypothetical protein
MTCDCQIPKDGRVWKYLLKGSPTMLELAYDFLDASSSPRESKAESAPLSGIKYCSTGLCSLRTRGLMGKKARMYAVASSDDMLRNEVVNVDPDLTSRSLSRYGMTASRGNARKIFCAS